MTQKRAKKTKLGYATFFCFQCQSVFNDLDMWREILESANIEAWEIEQALAKADLD